jgi:hypothetical protein
MGFAVSTSVRTPVYPSVPQPGGVLTFGAPTPGTTAVPQSSTPTAAERIKEIGVSLLESISDSLKARIKPETPTTPSIPAGPTRVMQGPTDTVPGRSQAASVVPNQTMGVILAIVAVVVIASVARG